MLIEIKNWNTKEVIFSFDCENNTIKKTVEEAVKRDINLSFADLRKTNLSGADLRFAKLRYANLSRADLSCADIRKANLDEANLSNVKLSYACLSYVYLGFADLHNTDLSNADLSRADLSCADIRKANLRYANLSYADLNYTNLLFVDLRCADLSNASFFRADLSEADLSNANLNLASLFRAKLYNAKINYHMNIPEGEFIAWKKIRRKRQKDYVIVKLKILADSQRSRATSDKCRCDKALVLGFETLEGSQLKRTKQVTNYSYAECTYKVGEIVYADRWDIIRWNECSHGIHFFLDRQNAVEYQL